MCAEPATCQLLHTLGGRCSAAPPPVAGSYLSNSAMPPPLPEMSLAPVQFDGVSAKDLGSKVHGVIKGQDALQKEREHQEISAMGLDIRSNLQQVTLRIVLHEAGGTVTSFLTDVTASISLSELKKAVQQRCGDRLRFKLQLSWLDEGEVVKLDFESWRLFVQRNWCTMPWEVHGESRGPDEHTWRQPPSHRHCGGSRCGACTVASLSLTLRSRSHRDCAIILQRTRRHATAATRARRHCPSR